MMLLRDLVERAEAFGPSPAVVDGATRLSYAEMMARARRLAGSLKHQGVAPGDRVALIARNSFRYLELNYACALAEAVLVPLNFRLAQREIDAILALTEPKMIFLTSPFAATGA